MRGMERVYQRGHVWWVQYSFNGRKHRESTRSRNRGDAVRLLRSRLEEVGRGRLIGPALEKTTFDDLAELLADVASMSGARTIRNGFRNLMVLTCPPAARAGPQCRGGSNTSKY